MDYQVLFNVALTVVSALGGWTLNRIYTALDRLDSDVRDMPKHYVGKDDYRTDIQRIETMLNKIFDLLNEKADK